ncbi:Na+/H+ antiporter [Amycolatopsis suaedae]|uniref:Na+/H+ antiporter n=1 Tax=Amycolatopsis suaedae TaxID=2510978 RepID=A0A4Q7J6S7_9PSEU|nr:Na+/H+ antiporter [Amycolatopsis suaedae]RZQ61714.1 Na+/H+ antiporter [Amycolatopsis suaedae]
METAAEIAGLVVVVLAVTGIARRFDWPEPLCLIVVGVGLSFIPGVPHYELSPEVVLFGLLPPLLYATAIRTSLIDIKANRSPIGLLSVGLVAFTTVAVGLVTWWVIPDLPLAAGLALGAVVAPPDAVAATAVARRVGMPRKIVRILEGESLINDAAALVALRTAIAAIAGSVTLWEVGGDFLLAAGGGIVAGLLIGFVASAVRKRLDDPVLDTALSLVVPFVAYIAAEVVHGSGVLAVVIAGLMLGHQAPRLLSGSSRLASRLNWRTIQFLLENVVFLLIGLQLSRILAEAGRSELGIGTLVVVCTAVLLATVATRLLWMYAIGGLRRLLRGRAWPWTYSTVIGWAGMRGVVTLAAAFVLPPETPHRAVLVLAAFTVVAGTLLVQGTTLPRLVRSLRLPAPDPAEDALQEAGLLHDMKYAAMVRLDEIRKPEDPEDVIDRLRDRLRQRTDAAWERLGTASELAETPSEAYLRLRTEMLAAEREVLLRARDQGRADDVVLRRVLETLDIEESTLDQLQRDAAESDSELTTPAATAGSCRHLGKAPADAEPNTAGCEECLAEGKSWVHLRICLECGHVGCCDSSPGRHATAHFHDSRHPVMRSHEPGESWRWCFVDRALG